MESMVEKEMEQGHQLNEIVQNLSKDKTKNDELKKEIEPIYKKIIEEAKSEKYESNTMLLGVLSGLGAAIVGAVVWAVVTVVTDSEIGFMAIGMGILVGAAMLLVTKKKKGLGLQVIGVIMSILGIALGKYLSVFYFMRQFYAEETGFEIPIGDLLNLESFSFMTDLLIEMFDVYDVLWIVLAILVSFGMLQGKKIDLTKYSS